MKRPDDSHTARERKQYEEEWVGRVGGGIGREEGGRLENNKSKGKRKEALYSLRPIFAVQRERVYREIPNGLSENVISDLRVVWMHL